MVLQVVDCHASQENLLIELCLNIQKWCTQNALLRAGFNQGWLLQHVLAVAGLLLRKRIRMAQPLDADFQQ
jgi:hypothetical protein